MGEAAAERYAPIEARRLRAFAGVGAAALVAFGILCWIAANWSALNRLTKLGLVGGLLAVAALIAMVAPRARIPALLVATATSGGLLALIGQIYPSGADAWQLFAYWSVLALPFALAARHDSIWCLWTSVAATGIGLWRIQEQSGRALADWGPAWVMMIVLAVLLCPALPLQRWIGRSAWAFRLASFGAIVMITSTAIEIEAFWSAGDRQTYVAIALAALGAGAYGLSLLRPAEIGLLALDLLAIDAILIYRVAIALEPLGDGTGVALLLGIAATAIVGASIALLRRIAPRRESNVDHFDWPLAALSGFGAVFAAIPFLAFYTLAFEVFLKEPENAAILGACTLAVGMLILRGGVAFGFRQTFGMIAAAVGLALIGYAAIRWREKDAGFIVCLVIAATAFFAPARWIRSVLGFAAAITLIASVLARAGVNHANIGLAFISLIAAIGALARAIAALGLRQDALMKLGDIRPFASGWTVAAVCVLAIFAGQPFLAFGETGGFSAPENLLHIQLAGPALAVSIALGLVAGALLLVRRIDLRTPLGIAIIAAAVALTLRSPTLGATLFVFVCAFLAGARPLAGFAAFAALWIVSAFYTALSWPLTQKAYVLIGIGLALGAVVLFTRQRDEVRQQPVSSAPNALAAALAAIGLLLVGGVAAQATWQSEAIIRDGRQIFMTLRPVDPRSLVQGDYMALAFDTARLPSPENSHGEVMAVASVDGRSIAVLQSLLQPGVPPLADQIALRLRVKKKRWFVGSDAYFFEEGRGKAFELARYGVFRVGPNGRLILVALANDDLKILP